VTLKALFAIPIVVILLVTLSLAGMIVSREWSGHASGAVAIAATSLADALTRLQERLRQERTITLKAFQAIYPLPGTIREELGSARAGSDSDIATLLETARQAAGDPSIIPEAFLREVQASLVIAREQSDRLLSVDRPRRTHAALAAALSRRLGPSLFGPSLSRAALGAIEAEPELAGIVGVARVGRELREELVTISSIMLPRIIALEPPTEADLGRVRTLLAQADVTTRMMEDTLRLANPSEKLRALVLRARAAREATIQWQLDTMIDANQPDGLADRPIVWLSWPIEYWADRVNELRIALIRESAVRARLEQASRTRRLDLAMMAVGAVALIILSALIILQRRVVGPLAQLGFAITRIADGDRRRAFVTQSTTREIAAMVTAVETLRQAALIADATSTRQREAADRRLLVLREVLGIVGAVYEPSHALERDVAKLSAAIDATIALLSKPPRELPPTLAAAARAVRAGSREIQAAARDLDAAIAAVREAEDDALPETEIVARILRVRAHIDRRDALVRAFVQPCLLALRDIAPAADDPQARMLRDLIGDQFELIETTVGTMASMLAAVTRAAAIVRELPLEAAPLAA
jgi:hypothetical protein